MVNQRKHLEDIEMLENRQLIRGAEGQDICNQQLRAFWSTGEACVENDRFISGLDKKGKEETEDGKGASKANE